MIDHYRDTLDDMFPDGAEARTQVGLEEPPEGMVLWRRLPDGAHIGVTPLTFGAALLTYAEPGQKHVYLHGWMFDAEGGGVPRAISQALIWEPSRLEEPDGWVRTTYRATTARYRRRPEGDPDREYEAD